MRRSKMSSGIKVKSIWWNAGSEGYVSGLVAGTGKVRTMETLNEFHGEYDLDWVIEKHDGVEVSRHNCKLIESINWEDGEVP
jgi:hypothetical protein